MTGPVGLKGATGASGVVTSFGFDADWGTDDIDVNFIIPVNCQTAAYTAGPGETALVSLSGSFIPSVVSDDALRVAVALVVNGMPAFASANVGLEGLQDGVGSASAHARIPLTAGSTYIFAGSFASAIGPVTTAGATCSAIVTIAKP
jgi:hypothetical protein